jgi:hypothetical protein
MTTNETSDKSTRSGLAPEKREDIWAILIATGVLTLSIAAPETVHNVFKNLLYLL